MSVCERAGLSSRVSGPRGAVGELQVEELLAYYLEHGKRCLMLLALTRAGHPVEYRRDRRLRRRGVGRW